MLGLHEGRHADPLRALLAHARHAHDVADSLRIHEQRHGVAADAGTDHGAVGYLGGTIVRAAGTEIRRAALFGRQRQRQLDAHAFGAGGHQPVTDANLESPAQRLDEVVSGQRAERGEQRPVVLVGLSDDAGMVRLVVQGVLQQRFDVGALLLDHEYLRDATSEVAGPFGAEGDGHAHPHEPHAGVSNRFVAAEAQTPQRLANLAVGNARGHDCNPGIGRVDGGVVQVVGRRIRDGQLVADFDNLALDVDRVGREEVAVGPVAVQLAVDQRDDRVEPVGIQQHRRGAVCHIGHDLETRPQPRRPRHRNRVAAQVERFGRCARIEHRDVQVSHRPRRARGDRRALGGGVVAGDGDGAAAGISAGEHRMAQRVGSAVHAGRLRVPQPEHAVVGGIRPAGGQLAAHDSGRGLLLIDSRRMDDRQIGCAAGRLDRGVIAAEGRTRVARNESGRTQPGAPVGP